MYKASYFLILILSTIYGCHIKHTIKNRHGEVAGNNIVNFINRKPLLIDPIDDTINYKKESQKIFKDTAGRLFILSQYQDMEAFSHDTTFFVEYFQDISDQVDLKSYRSIKDDYFTTKGKVFMWWSDMQHTFPIEIHGANPDSFQPFENLAGGKDERHVFYGGPSSDFKIISGADPKTIRILNPKRGCWNCDNAYFADESHVFFGNHMIKNADPKTFHLVNQEKADGTDKNHKYLDGEVVK